MYSSALNSMGASSTVTEGASSLIVKGLLVGFNAGCTLVDGFEDSGVIAGFAGSAKKSIPRINMFLKCSFDMILFVFFHRFFFDLINCFQPFPQLDYLLRTFSVSSVTCIQPVSTEKLNPNK